MRYLAQLARETTARVLPRRAPAWAPAQPLRVEEAFVIEPAAPPGSAAPGQAQTRGGPQITETLRTRDEVPADHEEDQRAERRLEPPRAHRRRQPVPPEETDVGDLEPGFRPAPTALVAPRQPPRHPVATASTEVARPVGQEAMPGRAFATRRLSADPRVENAVLPEDSPRPGQAPVGVAADPIRPMPPYSALADRAHQTDERRSVSRPDLNSTLSLAFAEIARRQALLEAQHREEEAAERPSRRSHSSSDVQPRTSAPERPRLQEAEPADMRLSIGSIIVQADPPPAAPIRPPKPPPASPRIRWARSFADR